MDECRRASPLLQSRRVFLKVLTRRRTLIGLLAAAVCLVAGIAAAASSARQAAPPSEPRVIEVIAKRYAFEPAQIEVIQGERIRMLVKSADGLHGFEIKKFKVSKEIPRGSDAVAIEFTATEAGSFPILCSVFCGDGHDGMKGTLVVTARSTP
jgi:cytochrome c oxidase subunit 2